MKSSLDNFQKIIDHVEHITGLQAFSVEILRQSDNGRKGCKETMFYLHKDTDGNKMGAQLTTVILFSDNSSSIKVLNFAKIIYLR